MHLFEVEREEASFDGVLVRRHLVREQRLPRIEDLAAQTALRLRPETTTLESVILPAVIK